MTSATDSDGSGTAVETNAFRSKSFARLAKAGIALPATLPQIDDFSLRPLTKILDRMLCLNAVAAVAHGFDRVRASAWLSQEGVTESLTGAERLLLESGAGDRDAFKVQVEGLWALAWIVGIVEEFDFWRECDPRFVAMLPDLRIAESSARLRSHARLRDMAEIGAAADLAYCLHWVFRESEIRGEPAPTGLISYVVVERRRAFEWAIGSESWDNVPLDT